MSNKRDLRLDQYNISKYRYRELHNFCLQYDEFIKENAECYYISGMTMGSVGRSNDISNPTANKAEKAYTLGKQIELIEQTVMEACGELYPWILKAVTNNVTWDMLQPPCGRKQFYESRRRFFFLLSLKKG